MRRDERRAERGARSEDLSSEARLPAPQARIPERAVGRARIPVSSSVSENTSAAGEDSSSEARIAAPQARNPRGRRRTAENTCLVERSEDRVRRRP